METSNVGSVVEFSPATREARVRFPDVAIFLSAHSIQLVLQILYRRAIICAIFRAQCDGPAKYFHVNLTWLIWRANFNTFTGLK